MSYAVLCDQAWRVLRNGNVRCDGSVTSVSTQDVSTLDPALIAQWISAGLAIGTVVWGTAFLVRAVVRTIR